MKKIVQFPRLPASLIISTRGSCVPCAIACLSQLRTGDFVVQGVVRFGNRGWWHQHTWMEVQGVVFDPTVIQFQAMTHYPDIERKEGQRFTPKSYRAEWDYLKNDFWRERLRQFGVEAL